MAWLLLALGVGVVLMVRDVSATTLYSTVALVAFSPAILAYGRVLGSSWHALKQSSEQIAKGRSSPSTTTCPTLDSSSSHKWSTSTWS